MKAMIVAMGALLSGMLTWPASAADQGQWVTLGTSGGPPIRTLQSQIANALVVGESIYVFDAGDGVLRQMALANLPVARIKAMFLTHHHPDHVMGVGALMLSRSANATPMQVLGPPGTTTLISGLARAYRPVEVASYGAGSGAFAKTVRPTDFTKTLNAPTVIYQDENIKVSAIDVDHYQMPRPPKGLNPRAVAYRIEVGGRSIVYTGDYGPSTNLITLARDADMLVTEIVDANVVASGAPGSTQANWAGNHCLPTCVGHHAAAANVKMVVLTHYVGRWDGGDTSGFTKGISDEYKGPVLLAKDLDRF